MKPTIAHIKSSRKVLVASHCNPDGDAIGSLIAMGLTLRQLGKEVVLFNESAIPAVYRFLTGVTRVQRHMGNANDYDTAIVIDCGDLERIGSVANQVTQIPVVINIDHHLTNTGFGQYQIIDADACASAEIIYRLLNAMQVRIDRAVATALYTGILTDTGSFRFTNTNRAAFAICEELIRLGVDPAEVARNVYGRYSMGRIKLLNLALDSIEISENGKMSMMALTQDMLRETGTNPEDVEGLINYAKRIEDIRVAVLIQEQTNGEIPPHAPAPYHVSLRSDGSVDVARIASRFGGGGHASAAGFSIESTLQRIKSQILDLSQQL